MIFNFRILGLFLLFILVTIYSLNIDGKTRKNNFFSILIATYLAEFLYIICFITGKNNFYEELFIKGYYILLGIILTLYNYYFISIYSEEKYKCQERKVIKEKKVSKIYIFIAILLVTLITSILKSTLMKQEFIILFGIYGTFANLLVILVGNNIIKMKKLKPLLGFIFLESVFIILQYRFPEIEILQSGIIILTTYLYLTIENIDKQKIDTLELEKDYANKNLMNKELFLKKLSHEIRTPINTIDGFSQIIEESNSLDDVKEEIKDIRQASKELIDLINSMIDLSIIESGELKILNDNYNIYDTLEDLVKMIPSRLKSKDIKFNYTIEKDVPEVLSGDSERIRQVILNIISNSIKYTEKGTIKLEVSKVLSNSLCRLLIKISDTGKGMTKEEISHLLDEESVEQGIGIKIAYYLVKLMNGNLEIESTKEKGTTVNITIDQEIVALKEEKKKTRKKEIKPISLKGKRVLLVDDNKLNLKVASKLLVPYEVEAVSANSGEECLEILDKDTKFDLILIDDLMPNLSGTETLDILRKIERVSGYYIPIVVVTANATSGMKEKYLTAGFDDYISKPIEREELDRVLKKYLKK